MRPRTVPADACGCLRTGASRGVLALMIGLAATGFGTLTAYPQAGPGIGAPPADTELLLEADQLIYDYDVEVVSAVGTVKIYYGGYALEADRVTYDQRSGRLLATGRVQLTEPGGNVINADTIDITDDFRDGFVRALRVTTPDRTYFAAEGGDRSSGRFTRFVRGVYTACEPCEEKPQKPPQWQIKAARIIHDQQERMIYFYNASLEMFGVPIAWVPYFSTPDPTVRRRSGILAPEIRFSQPTGIGVGVPYFWNLAPNYDVTFSPVFFSRQGFLAQAEWRHRLHYGVYSFKVAGIRQRNPGAFPTVFSRQTWRGGIRAAGEFNVGPDWTLGWDGTLVSDRAFVHDYGALTADTKYIRSEAHLTGLRDRNFFDARLLHFRNTTLSTDPRYAQSHQGRVHPVMDYSRFVRRPVLGGELSLDGNLTSVSRRADDPFTVAGDPATYYWGVAGTHTRLTQQLNWRRSIAGPWGQVFQPLAFARGDAFFRNDTASAAPVAGAMTAGRAIGGVGLEWRWPWLVTAGKTRHLFEPVAQIIARPGNVVGHTGQVPNEDAQSLVFDTTTLFEWDKFSGYDLVETGTRLNLGVRYRGEFGPASVEAVFGQSFHLAGVNAFAAPNLTNTGAFSGLETARSDYVGSLIASSRIGSLTARGRFDESTFDLQSGLLGFQANVFNATLGADVHYFRDYPHGNAPRSDVFVVNATASTKLGEYLTLSGGISYDASAGYVSANSIGLSYSDECLLVGVTYSESRLAGGAVSDRSVLVRIALRTLGDVSIGSNQLADAAR